MAFDFPSSPTVGQQFSPVPGVTYTYNGYGWTSGGNTSGLTLLATRTASNSVTVDFLSLMDSRFDEYEVHFFGVLPVTAANSLMLQIGQGGVIKIAAGYVWATQSVSASSTFNNGSGGSINSTVITMGLPANITNTAGMGASGVVRIVRPAAVGTFKNVQTSLVQMLNTLNMLSSTGAGMWVVDTNPIDSLRFLMNSGNIASGTFKLYGVA